MSYVLPHEPGSYVRLMAPGAVLGLLLFALALPLRPGRLRRMGLASPAGREWALLLLFVYAGAMAFLTLTPPLFSLADVLRGEWTKPFFCPGTLNLTPLYTFRFGTGLILGNVLLFVPFPFFAQLLWRGGNWRRAVAVALCVTAGIEVWQHFVGRMSDVDDLMLNFAGGMLGWGLWLVLKRPGLHCEER